MHGRSWPRRSSCPGFPRQDDAGRLSRPPRCTSQGAGERDQALPGRLCLLRYTPFERCFAGNCTKARRKVRASLSGHIDCTVILWTIDLNGNAKARTLMRIPLQIALAVLIAVGAADAQDQNRFRGMDSINDGTITRAEWRGNDRAFRNQDWNGDGVLSGDEVRRGAQRQNWNQDWNRDGIV